MDDTNDPSGSAQRDERSLARPAVDRRAVRVVGDAAAVGALVAAHLPLTVVVIDEHGLVVALTEPHARAWRSDVAANAVGLPWRDVVSPALVVAAELDKRVARAQETGREIVLPRVDVVLDGSDCAVRVHIVPVDAGALLQVQDLTDVVASEARARRAEHMARLATMAASVAHEIRNPLAGISGTVQVVQGTLPPDDKRAVALQKVQEHIVRLGSLVGDLLSFSRPIQVHARTLDLAVIAQAAASAEPSAKVDGRGIALGDAALVTQVLLNLIQNAAQAGASQIRLTVEGATLRVVDDGPGIPDDTRDKVFEPFFTTKTRGTGLGLPIARKMVEAMNGTLTLCKSPLGGAGFEMQLRPSDD